MTRADAMRKLLALGDMDRLDIENCTRWPGQEVANALAELRRSEELIVFACSPARYAITGVACDHAFAGA